MIAFWLKSLCYGIHDNINKVQILFFITDVPFNVCVLSVQKPGVISCFTYTQWPLVLNCIKTSLPQVWPFYKSHIDLNNKFSRSTYYLLLEQQHDLSHVFLLLMEWNNQFLYVYWWCCSGHSVCYIQRWPVRLHTWGGRKFSQQLCVCNTTTDLMPSNKHGRVNQNILIYATV